VGIFNKPKKEPLSQKKPKSEKSKSKSKPNSIKKLTVNETAEIFNSIELTEKQKAFAIRYFETGIASHAARVITNSDNDHYLRTLGSFMLKELRAKPFFLEMINCGWSDLIDAIDTVKIKQPSKYLDILMKLNKEDTTRLEVDGPLVINIVEPDA